MSTTQTLDERIAAAERDMTAAESRPERLSAMAALVVALVLGAVLARRVARPVQQLSSAAAALTAGTFDAPLPQSRIDEVARVAGTFDEMRNALAARLSELRSANAALVEACQRAGLLDDVQRELLGRAHAELLRRALACTLDQRPRINPRDAQLEGLAAEVAGVTAALGLAFDGPPAGVEPMPG